jgi:hypothetical protein
MRLTGTLYDQTGNRKSTMAAAKTEVLINSARKPLRNAVSTAAKPMFLGFIKAQAYKMEHMQLGLKWKTAQR